MQPPHQDQTLLVMVVVRGDGDGHDHSDAVTGIDAEIVRPIPCPSKILTVSA